jgi:hypothetical protein
MPGKKPAGFESYPARTVLAMNLVFVINYLIGIYILSQLWIGWGALFLLYVLILELNVFREGCRYCYYYGKRCATGKGGLAPLFFKKGNPKKFCEKEVKFKNLVPNILVLMLPTVGGAILLYLSFSWLILGLVVVPWLIWFLGNPVLYGKLSCPSCRQGSICCPAADFFSGKSKKKKK